MFPPTSSSFPCSHNNVSLPLLRCKKTFYFFSSKVPLCPTKSLSVHPFPQIPWVIVYLYNNNCDPPPALAPLCVFDMISSPLQHSDPDF